QAVREAPAAQRHLEECSECFDVLEALARLDDALGAMSPVDAPDVVVKDLLARVEAERSAPRPEPAGRRALSPSVVRWTLASVASVLVGLSLVTTLRLERRSTDGMRYEGNAPVRPMPAPSAPATPPPHAGTTEGRAQAAPPMPEAFNDAAPSESNPMLDAEEGAPLRSRGYADSQGDPTAKLQHLPKTDRDDLAATPPPSSAPPQDGTARGVDKVFRGEAYSEEKHLQKAER